MHAVTGAYICSELMKRRVIAAMRELERSVSRLSRLFLFEYEDRELGSYEEVILSLGDIGRAYDVLFEVLDGIRNFEEELSAKLVQLMKDIKKWFSSRGVKVKEIGIVRDVTRLSAIEGLITVVVDVDSSAKMRELAEELRKTFGLTVSDVRVTSIADKDLITLEELEREVGVQYEEDEGEV
ncbi:hypothetical protein J7J18_03005 [bacterium]|nr:hypothetical protein [bacterium]